MFHLWHFCHIWSCFGYNRQTSEPPNLSHQNLVADMMVHSVQGVTSDCAEPPIDIKTKVLFWPGQARTGQAKTELLFWSQHEVRHNLMCHPVHKFNSKIRHRLTYFEIRTWSHVFIDFSATSYLVALCNLIVSADFFLRNHARDRSEFADFRRPVDCRGASWSLVQDGERTLVLLKDCVWTVQQKFDSKVAWTFIAHPWNQSFADPCIYSPW